MTEILEIILKTLSGYTIKKLIQKVVFLYLILPRNEVKRNLDREIKEFKTVVKNS